VLQTLPALDENLWVPSLNAVWAAVAAIDSAYAPRTAAAGAHVPDSSDSDSADSTFDRAVAHGDEHVIKFADTAIDVYRRCGNPNVLSAAIHAMKTIAKP
jgi:hypothetical protein